MVVFIQYLLKVSKNLDMYKFRFETPQGDIIDKADPYAYFSELRPGTASKFITWKVIVGMIANG